MRRRLHPACLALLAALGCENANSPVAPSGTVLVISANPKTIGPTGSSTVTVIARHSSGVPARSGTEILLTSTLGSIDSRVVTNDDGVAIATLHGDGRAGTAAVTAQSGAAPSVTTEVVVGATSTQPTAAFVVTTNESLTAIFTDTSTGNPTSREWRFGDGTTSVERDPVHTYANAGAYLVSLRAANADGEDTFTKTVTVPASEATAPVANFDAVVRGRRVTFTDKSTNNPSSWEWRFGDGGTSTVRHPIHDYRRGGIYSVTLTVANLSGRSSVSRSVAVTGSSAGVTP